MERIISPRSFLDNGQDCSDPFRVKTKWNACWIAPSYDFDCGVVTYTLHVELPRDTVLHLSAGDRYILRCDGKQAGRGPAKGTHSLWYYDSYLLPQGEHELSVLVCSQGKWNAWSQISHGNRFILQAEAYQDLLNTGNAPWKCQTDPRYSFTFFYSPQDGKRVGTSGRFVFDANRIPDPPAEPVCLEPGYEYSSYDIQARMPRLKPNPLPPMVEKEMDLSFSAQIAPHSSFRKLIPLDNYYCAYPILRVTGGKGSKITLQFSEGLYDENNRKGSRAEYEGKEFRGIGDIYYPNGEKNLPLTPLWWLAGRYLLIEAETAEQPLQINSLVLAETHYPFEMQADLSDTPPLLRELAPKLFRTLQMCMHETYMDCPHYEQLMYLGDTRIQMLVGYATNPDTRLAEHAIELLSAGMELAEGELPCTYPVNGSRVIPGFCLYFVGILYDYLTHVGNPEKMRPYLLPARTILDKYLLTRREGLVPTPAGWNFYDWTEGWPNGIPPEQNGFSYEFNAHLAYTLMLQSETEQLYGETELSARYARRAREISAELLHRGGAFSEHTLCFLLLSGTLAEDDERRLLESLRKSGGKTLSVYFSHYLFEVFRKFGLREEMDAYLERWNYLTENGMYTVPEEFTSSTRSDCHAWGAHPLYHYLMRGSTDGKIPGFSPANLKK